MTIKIGINGFGRIGRMLFRAGMHDPELECVAINDLGDTKLLAHLLKYDSVARKLDKDVRSEEGKLIVGGKELIVYHEKDPANIPWSKHGVDIVLECTGFFRTEELAMKHIDGGGAKKVLISAPAKGGVPTIVYNVNHETITADDKIVSGASCTTNCLAPFSKVLNDNWGIKRGWMTTIHAYTGDQKVLDAPHADFRRARAAAVNMIPTSTGAAVAIGLVIPELAGKLDGMAVRVPVPTGSCVDLVVELEKTTTAEEINAAMKVAAEGDLKDTFEFTMDPIVSSDIVGSTAGSILDGLSTKVMDGNFVKVLSWYDNENSYVSQFVRLAKYMAGQN